MTIHIRTVLKRHCFAKLNNNLNTNLAKSLIVKTTSDRNLKIMAIFTLRNVSAKIIIFR